MKKIVVFIVFLYMPAMVSAAIITQYESTELAPQNNYYHHFSLWWDDDNDPSPNPCYGEKACTIMFGPIDKNGRVYSSTADVGTRIFSDYVPGMLTARTMGELRKVYAANVSLPAKGRVTQSRRTTPENVCITMTYKPLVDSNITGARPIPNVICGTAPPPIGTCEINDSVISLNHGTISSGDINGNRASAVMTISCSKLTLVKVFIVSVSGGNNNAGKINLRDDGSITTNLTLDGTQGSLGKSLIVDNGGVTINVESTLQSSGEVGEGEFRGQAIAIITVY